MHRDLGVLDAASGPPVVALHPDTVDALLDVAGLVNDQDRASVIEGIDDVIAQIIADSISVPASASQHQRPSSRGPAHAAAHQEWLQRGARRSSSKSCDPDPKPSPTSTPRYGEVVVATISRRDPIDYRGELRLPPIRVYAVSRGDRGVFGCLLHKLCTTPRSRPLKAQTRHRHQSRSSTAAVLSGVIENSRLHRRPVG